MSMKLILRWDMLNASHWVVREVYGLEGFTKRMKGRREGTLRFSVDSDERAFSPSPLAR